MTEPIGKISPRLICLLKAAKAEGCTHDLAAVALALADLYSPDQNMGSAFRHMMAACREIQAEPRFES